MLFLVRPVRQLQLSRPYCCRRFGLVGFGFTLAAILATQRADTQNGWMPFSAFEQCRQLKP